MAYSPDFFAANRSPALRSAEIVLPGVLRDTWAKTIIDLGCSQGAWLSVAKQEVTTERVLGVDGHCPRNQVMLDPEEFVQADLTSNLVPCGKFELALCLEVAEHLPESAASSLVATLCQSRFVLFSPAIPGQRGEDHINEQWSTYWAAHFDQHGYKGSCDLRWRHWTDQRVEICYRQNMLMFAKPEDLASIGYREQVIDVVHPELWELREAEHG